MREREIYREKDGDRVNKIGLQQPRRSSTAATRLVLGGSGIVEGRFERSVSLAAWERQIGDVGGEMGFTSVRESFALVDRVHAELEVGEVRLSERRKWRKPIGAEGKTAVLLVRVWVDLGPTSARGMELCFPLVGAWGEAEELGKSDCVE